MATIHTNSVREELTRIKEEFAAQTKANKVSSESSMLIKSLIMLLEIVFSIFLEKTTKKTSRNSSKPSSQTSKDNTSINKKGSNGKGKSEDIISADNSRTVVTDTVLPVDACSECGELLENIKASGRQRRTRIDIVFEKTVEHFDTRYEGCIIHDCWASYLSYTHCTQGLCGSHLLRELTFIFDANEYKWAKSMKHLLQAACRKVSKSKSKKLTKRAYKNLQKRYRTILTCGKKELPSIPTKSKNKNGKIAKSDAHNLWDRLKKYEDAVLRFACDPHVSFTNNRAEQDLRMTKVKQKVSGCFRSEIYAKAYCRISSYLQTMANKGINPLIAIQMALNGEICESWGE